MATHEFPPQTRVTALWPSSRAEAIKAVAIEMDIEIKVVAVAGKKYYDKIVPDEMEYLMVDPKERNLDFWQKVDSIVPPATQSVVKQQ